MKKHLGQYFTTHPILLNKLTTMIHNKDGKVLEPSCGEGHIIHHMISEGETRKWVAIELDTSLKPIDNNLVEYINDDFLEYKFTETFSTIVGNPPYVKLKNSINLYLLFLEKCITLLEEGGEMIMIIPSDFLLVTSGCTLRLDMCKQGSITHIYRPNNENLFTNATQDVIIIRYVYGNTTLPLIYQDNPSQLVSNDGFFYIGNNLSKQTISDLFHIKVGMVSGCDSVFRHSLGNREFVTRNGKHCSYIFIDSFPTDNCELNDYLVSHKARLLNRKIRKFTDLNWYEWGAIRNNSFVLENMGRKCLYMETLTRDTVIVRDGTVNWFDGNILCILPKSDNVDLELFRNYFNSSMFRDYFCCSGRFKIGQQILAKYPIKQ